MEGVELLKRWTEGRLIHLTARELAFTLEEAMVLFGQGREEEA